MKIVVIGGTGLIGSKTVAILRQGGHEVVAAAPNSGVNTITGEGVKEAVAEEANCRLIYADLGRGAGDSPDAAYPYINLKFCNTRRLFSRSFNMLLNISAGSKGKLTGQKEDPLEQAPRPLDRGINSQDWIEFRPLPRGSLR